MKTKRKPWYRPRNIALGFLALFICFLAWAGYWVYWALTVEPNPSIDYAAQLEQLARDAQPPGENGWPDIERAIAIFEQLETAFPEEERLSPWRDGFAFEFLYDPAHELPAWVNFGETSDVTEEQIRAELTRALDWLEEQGAWAALAEAGAKHNLVRPIDAKAEQLINLLLPEVATLRAMAKARVATFHLALERGDDVEAVQAMQDMLTLARAAGAQAMMINGLVGDAIRALAYERIHRAILDDALDEHLARRLLDTITINPPPANVTLYLEGERRIFLDLVQWYYSDDGNGDGTLLVSAIDPMMIDLPSFPGAESNAGFGRVRNIMGHFLASRAETTDKANELYDDMIRHATSTDPARWDHIDALSDGLFALGRRHVLISMLIPAVGKSVQMHDLIRMQHEGARIALALELYRFTHGSPPDSLDALTPTFLDADPIDPATLLPFGYKRLTNDEHGRTYLLYSYGRDRADNGGVMYDFGNPFDALTNKRAQGADFVINRPVVIAPRASSAE